jgi:hypothetical protein
MFDISKHRQFDGPQHGSRHYDGRHVGSPRNNAVTWIQVLSLAAVWVFFFGLQFCLVATYFAIYLLPYGFFVEKSFVQMPRHVQGLTL